MPLRKTTFGLRALLIGIAVVAWCILTFYPDQPNMSSTIADTGAEWAFQNQREYGWPWKCAVTHPSLDTDQPWDISLVTYTIREIRAWELIGNLAIVAALVFASLWFIRLNRAKFGRLR